MNFWMWVVVKRSGTRPPLRSPGATMREEAGEVWQFEARLFRPDVP